MYIPRISSEDCSSDDKFSNKSQLIFLVIVEAAKVGDFELTAVETLNGRPGILN